MIKKEAEMIMIFDGDSDGEQGTGNTYEPPQRRRCSPN
jgi:hypothetical protein